MTSLDLLERLDQGPVICAEGYVFEMERRGYVQAGAYVPEVVLAIMPIATNSESWGVKTSWRKSTAPP